MSGDTSARAVSKPATAMRAGMKRIRGARMMGTPGRLSATDSDENRAQP
jgi:hypothetical protein